MRPAWREVIIEDGELKLDMLSYNPAEHGCAACFNLQSYWRNAARRCQKHGGRTEFGETWTS